MYFISDRLLNLIFIHLHGFCNFVEYGLCFLGFHGFGYQRFNSFEWNSDLSVKSVTERLVKI